MAGWGDFFGKIAQQFSGRIERLKNEKTKLEAEKRDIEGRPWNEKNAVRLTVICKRIDVINGLLTSNAKD